MRLRALRGNDVDRTARLLVAMLAICGCGGSTSAAHLEPAPAPTPVEPAQPTVERSPTPIESVRFLGDGSEVLLADWYGGIEVWNLQSGERTARFESPSQEPLTAMDVSRDGGSLVTVQGGEPSAIVILWDVRSRTARATLVGHRGPVSGAAFFPDGTALVTWGDDGARLWDRSGRALRTLAVDVFRAAFGPGGRYATIGNDGTRIWDRASEAPIATLATTDGPIVFSPDGSRVLDSVGRLWDSRTGALVHELEAEDPDVFFVNRQGSTAAASFDSTGERIVTYGADGLLRIWTASGTLVAERRGRRARVHALFFVAGDANVAVVTNVDIELLDARSGEPLATVDTERLSSADSVDLSSDGERIVAPAQDGGAVVIDARTGAARYVR